jgi:D-3-phosphoglycerate dehydrogenase
MKYKNRIGILDLGYDSYDYETKLFSENGYSLKFFNGKKDDRSAQIAFCKDIEGLLVRMTVVDENFIKNLPDLKAIVRYGIGYDNIDLKAASRFGIAVANVQGYATQSVSDHTMALMFACQRGLLLAGQIITEGITKPPFSDIFEFHNKTLGIIGLGRIGRRFSMKARPLFKKIIACDPYISAKQFKDAGAQKSTFDEILTESSVISLHCNLTAETYHMLDYSAFSKMRQKPIVLNTARGPVIDEQALKRALENDLIHSAGIDVFENEPLSEKQAFLLKHPRVICTGHYAWYSQNAAQELQKRAAQNMIGLLKGEKIMDQLNKF